MDRHESSRRAAQHALLNALRQFCPQPLVELRDGLPVLSRPGKLPIVRLPTGRRRIDLAELDALIDDWAAGSR